MPIIRFAKADIDSSDSGVEARRLINREMGATSFTAGISVFGLGASILLHTHPCEEIVAVLDGEAVAELAGEQHTLHQFDLSFVPPGTPHRFLNKSAAPFTMMYVYPMVDPARDPVDVPAGVPEGALH